MNTKTFLITMATMFFLTFSTAQAQQSPEEFVVSLMGQASGLKHLQDKQHQDDALLYLVRQSFDIPTVGKFVLGRYWRNATSIQRAEFLEVFELAAVRAFSPLLKDIPLDTFKIIRVEYKHDTDIRVFSIIEPKKGSSIKIQWRLRLAYGVSPYKIIDITAEGVSLVVTLRSEYTTYIKRNGGVDGLIAILRKRLEK